MYFYLGQIDRPDADIPTLYGFATDSFRRHGLKIWAPLRWPPGNATIAGTPDGSVAVQVTFIQDASATGPTSVHIGGTTVVVSAFSDDQKRAETTRNNVQSDIQGAHRID